jgi:hypothetical protein
MIGRASKTAGITREMAVKRALPLTVRPPGQTLVGA